MSSIIEELNGSDDLAGLRKLFRHYADWLESDHAVSPELHAIDQEISRLPAPYEAPHRALFGARGRDGEYVGCLALRPLDPQTCEVKRLFVLPEVRGQRLGAALISALIEKACTIAFAQIVLDVGDYQKPARALYAKCGFREISPKDHIAYQGAVFMAYDL